MRLGESGEVKELRGLQLAVVVGITRGRAGDIDADVESGRGQIGRVVGDGGLPKRAKVPLNFSPW